MRRYLFTLFFILPCLFLRGQAMNFEDLANIAKDPTFPLRLQIEKNLAGKNSVDIQFFSSGLSPEGIFINQLLLPIIQDHQEEISYNMYFPTTELPDGSFIAPNGKDEMDMIDRLIAVQQLYPSQFIDFLRERGNSFFADNWETTATKMSMDTKSLQAFISSPKMKLIKQEHIRKGQEQNINNESPLLVLVNNKPLDTSLENLLPPSSCCDFYTCLGNCLGGEFADNALETANTIAGITSTCPECAAAPVPLNLACWGCGLAAVVAALDVAECIADCQVDPCDFDGGLTCGTNEYCHTTLTMLPPNPPTIPFSLLIPYRTCEECPTLEPIVTSEASVIRITAPEVDKFQFGVLINETQTSYDYAVKHNDIVVDYGSSSTSLDLQMEDYFPCMGDEFCVTIEGTGALVDCPNRQYCFTYECPDVNFSVIDHKLRIDVSNNEFPKFNINFDYLHLNGFIIDNSDWETSGNISYVYDRPINGGEEYCVNYTVSLFTTKFVCSVGDCSDNLCVIVDDCDLEEAEMQFNIISQQAESEAGAEDGSIKIEVVGGTPPYDISWDNGVSGALNFDLGSGLYCATVTDYLGCQYEECFYIELGCGRRACAPIQLSFNVTNASVPGAGDGSVVVSSDSGFDLYYYWQDIPGSTLSPTRSGLSPGEYCVTAFDDFCCFGTGCFTVEVECPMVLDVTASYPCKGNTGAIDITPLNTVGPYSYAWSTGAISSELNGLGYGTYTVTVTDGYGCTAIEQVNFSAVPPLFYGVDITPSCYGMSTGAIDLTVNGITAPFIYEWSNGNTTQDLNNLSAGTYEVVITNALGCKTYLSFNVDSYPEISLDAEIQYEDPGQSNGAIDLIIKGATSGLTFAWTGPNNETYTTEDIDGLAQGQYCVVVTDQNGCTTSECFTVGGPPLTLTVDVENSCGPNNGSAEAFVTGGTPPYTYFWTGGHTGSSVSSLAAGTYVVVVTDAEGMVRAHVFDIVEYPRMKIKPFSIIPCSGEGLYAYVGVTGGTPPYSYQWSNGSILSYIYDVDPGFYYVDVIDANGCIQRVDFDLNYTGNLIITALNVSNEITGCDNNTGSMLLDVTGGAPPYEYNLLGTNGYQITTSNPFIDNLESATYTVTVFDDCGNYAWIPVVIYPETNSEPFSLTAIATASCDNTSTGSGAIDLTVNGSGTYEYLWSNGSTDQDLDNISSGTYSVTVTNGQGCEQRESYTIERLPSDFLTTSTITHSCSNQSIGAIDLEVNLPGIYTYQWSNGATTQSISGLSAGTYTVTITNDVGCSEVNTYTINAVQDFDYEVEVLWHFNNEHLGGGAAQIQITSNQFEVGGDIFIAETGQEIFISGTNPTVRKISIPLEFSNVSTFHFTYIGPDGCEYEGTFDMIPTCTYPDNGFTFTVDHIGDNTASCGVGQSHTYLVNIFSVGNNAPYFIEVTMDEASHPSEEGYVQLVEYTGQNPFYIYDVPAGSVRFRSINNCENGSFNTRLHTNCCFDLSCDIIWDSPSDAHDGSHVYDYPYFRLWVNNLCYDGDCGLFDDYCSEIDINLNTVAPTFNCWTGTVTIEYPDGSTGVFEVIPNSPGNDEIEWVSGDSDWRPGGPGTYFVNISYVGNGTSTGQDCQTEQEVNFYGDTNYNDAVGLNDDFWFDVEALGAPSYFENSYFGAWRCEVCSEESVYIYENDQGECSDFTNWDFTFFSFVPNDYSNPCNSGGELTIMDFDGNNIAVIQTVQVAANQSLGQVTGMQPFGIDVSTWCGNSGWCLFDALDVYGFSMDKPLLATWADPQSCEEVIWDDPTQPNPDPCTGNEDCPPGFVCQDGDCYQLCPEGECLYGNCVEGICVEDEECDPDCPDGYTCIGGDCYLDEDICDFYVEVNGGSGVRTYEFYHNLAPGTQIVFEYNTLTREDAIQVSGSGINGNISCVGTGGWATEIYTITGGNAITVTVNPCETGSRYHLRITCQNGFNDPVPSVRKTDPAGTENTGTEGIVVHPNPFVSDIDITATNVETPFNGQVLLLDNLGRELINKEFMFGAGDNSLNIDGLENLPEGVYVILIKKDGKIHTSRKVVKIKL